MAKYETVPRDKLFSNVYRVKFGFPYRVTSSMDIQK